MGLSIERMASMSSSLRSVLFSSLVLAGCGAHQDTDLAGAFGADEGKADAAKSTKLVDDIALDSTVQGSFDPRVRVYGYLLEAKRGAKLTAALKATAGADANGPAAGAALDTLIVVHGPYKNAQEPGPKLQESDDVGASTSAGPVELAVEQDGKYLIAFTSFEDTGKGAYELSLSCEGTDLQCRRPDWDAPCKADTLYVQGAVIDADTTWDACETVLLENATVAQGRTLTIKPGVNVKGNFIGQAPFGNVQLTVNGTLQAAGTKEHPIAFTAFKKDFGWGGLNLVGPSHSISHAYIEKANVAVTLGNASSATLNDIVLEGGAMQGREPQAGVLGAEGTKATFDRALVKGFRIGLHLQNSEFIHVEDSVVRANGIGVQVDGATPQTGCSASPPAPPQWRDPVFLHSDIVENGAGGILINGSDVLIQVSSSNIIKNGSYGVEIRGQSLNPMSFIKNNNIHDNATPGAAQVRSYHWSGGGVLDISGNFWNAVSDPELSASWQIACNGTRTFTGFSPTKHTTAGPRVEKLTDPVKQQTWQQSH
jgi:hypothetical protein